MSYLNDILVQTKLLERVTHQQCKRFSRAFSLYTDLQNSQRLLQNLEKIEFRGIASNFPKVRTVFEINSKPSLYVPSQYIKEIISFGLMSISSGCTVTAIRIWEKFCKTPASFDSIWTFESFSKTFKQDYIGSFALFQLSLMTPLLLLRFSTVLFLFTFTYLQYFLGKKLLSATLAKVTEEKGKYSPGFRVPEVVNREIRSTFTPNGKREFIPRDQVFPLIIVNCLLLQLKNKQFQARFILKHCSGQFLSAYFLF